MQFMQGFAPQYQSGQAQVTKQYGMPMDPLQKAVGAGLGAYASLYNNYGQNTGTKTG